MEAKSYFGSTPKSVAQFLLDFERLGPILARVTRESVVGMPFPTKRELRRRTPLTRRGLLPADARAHQPHLRRHGVARERPHRLPHARPRGIVRRHAVTRSTEDAFWPRYFHHLFAAANREADYKAFVKRRSGKLADPLGHVLGMWKVIGARRKDTPPTALPRDVLLHVTGTRDCLASIPKLVPQLIRVVYPHISKSSTMYKQIAFHLTNQLPPQIPFSPFSPLSPAGFFSTV